MRLRNWFRATAVHNTLTLDNRTIEVTESVTKLWQPEGNTQILVTENPGYKDLKHRRSVKPKAQLICIISSVKEKQLWTPKRCLLRQL